MAKTRKSKKKKRGKSIEMRVQMIYDRADARIEAGCEAFHSGWQATLEIMLLTMEKLLLENPGQLLPMQLGDQEEWDFYIDILEQLDLPPDTCAMLVTPSAFKDMPIPTSPEVESPGTTPWQRDAYSLIISRCEDWTVVMQVSLPGLETVGIDVFEDGKHLADYTYNSIEECLEDLSKVVWIYFSPKGDWTEEGITRYTENWFAKTIYTFNMEDVRVHSEISYAHNPALLGLTPLESAFKLIRSTIPRKFDNLEELIETANDINRDFNLGAPVITEEGILRDNEPECQALLDHITLEIDQHFDMLDDIEGANLPHRSIHDPAYNSAYDQTAKAIYEMVTGRSCPELVEVGQPDGSSPAESSEWW